jgi:hypothetical protein
VEVPIVIGTAIGGGYTAKLNQQGAIDQIFSGAVLNVNDVVDVGIGKRRMY